MEAEGPFGRWPMSNNGDLDQVITMEMERGGWILDTGSPLSTCAYNCEFPSLPLDHKP